MAIKKLEKKKKYRYVLEQILQEIKQGELQVGDQLPSESQLADMTNVSRTSVREALAALRLTGVVESKGSKGTIVKKDSSEFLEESLISLLQKEVSPVECLEAREVLNRGSAPLVVKHITENDIAKLQEILEEMEESIQGSNIDRYLSLNKEFHLTIFKATENNLIIDMTKTLLSYTQNGLAEAERFYFYESEDNSLRKAISIHENILDSLRARNEKGYRESLRVHFNELGAYFDSEDQEESTGGTK